MIESDTAIILKSDIEVSLATEKFSADFVDLLMLRPLKPVEQLFNCRYPLDYYSDRAHARTVVLQSLFLKNFVKTAKLVKLDDDTIDAAVNNLYYITAVCSYYYQSLKGYKKYHWFENGKIREGNFEAALKRAVSGVLADKYLHRVQNTSAAHRIVIDLYNAAAIKKAGKRKIHLMTDGGRSSSKNLAKELVAKDSSIEVFVASFTTKSVFAVLRQVIKSYGAIGKGYNPNKIPKIFFYSVASKDIKVKYQQIRASFDDKFSNVIFDLAGDYISKFLESASGYNKQTQEIITKLQPAVVSTDAISTAPVIYVAKYAKELGAKIVFFNHGTASIQESAISSEVMNLWASLGRIFSQYATHHVVRSPTVKKLIESLGAEKIKSSEVIPLKQVANLQRAERGKKFNILAAGNFMDPSAHIPWILETPDEFLKGLYSLAEAVSKLDNAELVIRVKASKGEEINYDELAANLAHYKNVTLKSDGSFNDDLAKADLMVANLTTTLDEALQAGVPLLLHSGNMRFQYLKAMTTPPTLISRSVVYASTPKQNLVELLQGIVVAHEKNPLTAAELQGYTWIGNEFDMKELSEYILR